MLEELKEKVCRANRDLAGYNIVILTWGNVSAVDRSAKLVVIKPSGVSYDDMKAEDMVVVDWNGNVVEGHYRPSTDLPTHLELYKNFPEIGAVVHTHSTNATAWAQAGRSIPIYGTTHADHFNGKIPCTRSLTKQEVDTDYEKNTGVVISKHFEKISTLDYPGVLVKSHGVFAWGKDPCAAVQNALVIERIAEMALKTEEINHDSTEVDSYLVKKHYNRKHGVNSYYGQEKNEV